MDDLVKRLNNPPFGTETSERNLMRAAADRIEALKAEASELALQYLSDTGQMGDEITALHDRIAALDAKVAAADALVRLGVRELVAGWNGEGREKPYTPHDRNLGATICATCGVVYDLDAALAAYRGVGK